MGFEGNNISSLLRDFMKKNSINPNKAKLISSLLIAILFTTLIISLCSAILRSTLEQSHEQYLESCSHVADGYAQTVNTYLDNYVKILGCYYIPDQYEEKTPQEIQETLIDLKDFNAKIAPDFFDVSYVDLNGMAYSQNGLSYDVSDRDYYLNIIKEDLDTFVSDPVRSKQNGEPIINLSIAIYNSNHQKTGLLLASITLKTISNFFANIQISDIGNIVLMDSTGKFIIHSDENWLFKEFNPTFYGVEKRSSEDVIKMNTPSIQTVNVYGTPIRLFMEKIKYANWTLGLSVPQENEAVIIEQYKHKMVNLLFISLAALLILLFIEYTILDQFQKHQLLSTLYDPLTNLWTRQHFEHEATKWLRHSPHNKFMLIDCDIRGFKFVNQNYGEIEANKMLVRYSKMLIRVTNQYHGVIGRGFADRFYILFKISSVHKAMNTFKETLPSFNDEIKEFDMPFFPKFGITFLMPESNRHFVTIKGLIGQASFAKTTIKENMMVQYAIYNSRLIKKVNEEQFIEQHMNQALTNGEFFVMYQPKMSLTNDKIVGAEALVRWKNPEMGMLTPDKFISLFERNGFITKLDFYVYDKVFHFLEKQIANGKKVVPISVNMSRNHSKPDRFMHQFLEVFKRYSIPSELIQIEILERSFMDNFKLNEITNHLHNEGFTVAMDDFGSGESSLNMLTKIPVDVLKFDREFLNSSTDESGKIDEKSAGFIEILVELSKQLNKETVFEGVETQEQRDFLKSIQCDQAQGYFYSKPLTEEDFVKFIELHS